MKEITESVYLREEKSMSPTNFVCASGFLF